MSVDLHLQSVIESIYRLEQAASLSEFKIGAELLELFLGKGARERLRETFLVRPDGEHTDLAVYISEDVLRRAHAFVDRVSRRDLGALEHLDEFCVATEGVSHFVYFTFCGERMDRPVSQIELELQAEIDKFVVLRLLFPLSGEELITRLFDRFTLAERLSRDEQERYTVANRAGRRYSRWFHREFRGGRAPEALDDARRLYRMPLSAKLERIERAA